MEDDGTLEDDGMADSGYLESQANNMDPLMVRRKPLIKSSLNILKFSIKYKVRCDSISSVFY